MRLSLSVIALSAALAAPALAQETFPATLAGHAVLPALSLVAPPADVGRRDVKDAVEAAGARERAVEERRLVRRSEDDDACG